MKKITTLAIAVALTAMGIGPFAAKVQATSIEYYCGVSNGLAGGYFQMGTHWQAIEYCQWNVNQAAIAACSGQPDGDPFTLSYYTLYFPEGYGTWGFEQLVHADQQTYRCQDGWAVIV
jgi:hypothetical protein